jgi:tetratricopeptide (TPR) repeat protein
MMLVPTLGVAEDPKVQDKNVQKKSSSEAKTSTEPFVGPATEAKKLYKRYKRSFDKTIVAIACVKSPKCIEPEDEVLRYSKEALGILEKLDTLAAEGDVQANYYRGLIAFERMQYYDRQAEIVTHPDFILTNTVFRRYAKQQYLLAVKYFTVPAKINNPSACEYLGNLYLISIVGNPQKEKAGLYFYNAANAYIEQGNQIAAARMYNAMKENIDPADPRIIQMYAKLHNKEPIATWRKLPSDLVQGAPKKSEQH